jgi:hypothetical protein
MGDEQPTVQVEGADEREPGEGRQIEERPRAEKNLGLFFSPTMQGGGPGFLVPEPLSVGPGKPGPEDDWQVPSGPVETEANVLDPGHGAITELKSGDVDER